MVGGAANPARHVQNERLGGLGKHWPIRRPRPLTRRGRVNWTSLSTRLFTKTAGTVHHVQGIDLSRLYGQGRAGDSESWWTTAFEGYQVDISIRDAAGSVFENGPASRDRLP